MYIRISVFGVVVLCAGLLACPLHAQIPVQDLLAVEGPWECNGSLGIHGVFITASTYHNERSDLQKITSQAITIRVYEWQGGQPRGGTFSAGRADRGGSTDFDGKRLLIHFNGTTDSPPFEMDVMFDSVTQRWTGTWSLCEKAEPTVLIRPHPADGIRPSPFVGDWDGQSIAYGPIALSILHVRQSFDGNMAAWLSRSSPGSADTTRQIRVVSTTESGIDLVESNDFNSSSYKGTLSNDGKNVAGQWSVDAIYQGVSSTDGTTPPPVPYIYRRIDQPANRN